MKRFCILAIFFGSILAYAAFFVGERNREKTTPASQSLRKYVHDENDLRPQEVYLPEKADKTQKTEDVYDSKTFIR